ncbi:glucose-6-phosphate dehydrogenase assembly protein OpcA [Candidatus Chloroploca sp. Khr17]|uniref:glucose-6-phosphate dehydrogenase assembly protein OpcA n=1 Tax=Candidatus Chloroploca sp. Khr17 TaxID=2496869 RepID=UPI001F0E6E93|nr:glucose-6-phosphate dehydrogenase assembly protein OpcA [Candidatus Chloroploca sp. Khr17]
MTSMTMVEIGAIERELRQLWSESAEKSPDGQAVIRALTLNLIACTHDAEHADRMTDAIQQLTASHPSRAILALLQPDAPEPRLDGFVQANCLLSRRGTPQVCGEQITLDARGSAVQQVASLILALLVPDLPVVLWLSHPDPFDAPLLARLRSVVDRVMVNSQAFAQPTKELVRMAELERTVSSGGLALHTFAISDLTWASLTAWRELTAQFFDTRPLLPHLRRIDHVTITYQAPNGANNPVAGLLLAGWLASCLAWVPLEDAVSIEAAQIRFHLRRPAVGVGTGAIRLVTIDLCPVEAGIGAMPGLLALHLEALDGITASFRVERAETPGYALTTATIAGMEPISRLARCEEPSLADLLAAELRLRHRDQTFSDALRVAGLLAARLGRDI